MKIRPDGFTLIELLIVVAIIAILAAIAVPNFLEAQVRAKMSRAISDMRTISVGIESYSVDYNRVPLGRLAIGNDAYGGSSSLYGSLPADTRDRVAQSRLTTPVAYLSSIPTDVFGEKVISDEGTFREQFIYQSMETVTSPLYQAAYQMGYTWYLGSRGPAQAEVGGNPLQTLIGNWDFVAANGAVGAPYDPTNGTISAGTVTRTNKGIYPD